MRKLIYMVTLIVVMSSCSLYRIFETPEAPIGSLCGKEVVTQEDSSFHLPAWQQVFTDNALQLLIEKGLAANADLQMARLNVEQAEALLLSSQLAYLPSFAFAAEGSVSKLDGRSASRAYNLPLVTQWEIDVFGKLRNNKEQTRAGVMQSSEYARMVQTQLVASIANVYYTLVLLDEQLKITRDFVHNQAANLETIIAMKEAGMQTEAAVNQATANYYDVQTSAKDLETQIRMTENSLSLLLNQTPKPMERGSLNRATTVYMNYSEPIPLLALTNRPDVKMAEHALRGSFYGVNVARSAFYPSISLSGSAGWTNNIGVITNPGSMLLSAIGSLAQPLFARGMNRANLKVAKAKYEQSLLLFEKSLLVAGNEVNNALVACQNSEAKRVLRQKQVEANKQAFANSAELMKHSSVSYLEVLMAQTSLLQSKLLQAADWMEGVQGRINLYKALGGGVGRD